jgi:hypothetical protein
MSAIREQALIAILLAAITADTILSNLTDLIIPGISVDIRLLVFSALAILALLTGTAISLKETRRASK